MCSRYSVAIRLPYEKDKPTRLLSEEYAPLYSSSADTQSTLSRSSVPKRALLEEDNRTLLLSEEDVSLYSAQSILSRYSV